jgi:hypothetical protein
MSGLVARNLSGFICSLGGIMKPIEFRQEIRKMRFEEVYVGWSKRRLTQEDAARLLGVCDRTFCRYVNRYNKNGFGWAY